MIPEIPIVPKNSNNSNQIMETKTSETYKKEILEKYTEEKGGEVSIYLAEPTSANIRGACILLLNKRNSERDNHILNHFFQFKNESNKLKEIQNFDVNKFKPIVNFLRGKAKNTSTQNIELISWLIDFEPRPLQGYLRKEIHSTLKVENPLTKQELGIHEGADENGLLKNNLIEEGSKKLKEKHKERSKSKSKWIILGSFCVVFLIMLLIELLQTNGNSNQNEIENNLNSEIETRCMTWAINHYEVVSCNTKPYSKYGTEVLSYDEVKIKNFKKIEVNMATDFFAPTNNKPLVWYTKNKKGEIEYFTNPGLHPITGKTLDEITPYIIQNYVPLHSDNKESFLN